MTCAVTEIRSGGNDGAVESQHQAYHKPLGNRYRDSHISTAPTATSSSSTLISVDRSRPLRPLSPRQRRFAPKSTGFTSESWPPSFRNHCPTSSESPTGALHESQVSTVRAKILLHLFLAKPVPFVYYCWWVNL